MTESTISSKELEVVDRTCCLQEEGFHRSDLGNAERLARMYGDVMRFCHPWNKWLIWDRKCWSPDRTGERLTLGTKTVKAMYSEAGKLPDRGDRTELTKHALRSESESRIKAMLSLATCQPGIPILPEELDRDDLLFNVKNGTVDLRTGELRPHSKEDYITKMAPVKFQEGAECPRWLEFLDKVMMSNTELVGYLQRVAGYCLTGKTSEHKLFFLYGSGANGKSTFLKVLQDILGSYAVKTDSEMLIRKPAGSHTTALMDLKGARLALTIEVQEGSRLAESLTKELTGGDTITARRMRQDNESFEPTHKIVFAANHKPVVRDTTYALWRRIDMIPFNYVLPEEERVKDFHEVLLKERSGILAWMLEGCRAWQEKGLMQPPEVIAATEQYRDDMDVLADFISACCVVGPREEAMNKELRKSYEDWAEENGEKPISARAFSLRLEEKGFIKMRSKRNRYWKGISLQDADPERGGF